LIKAKPPGSEPTRVFANAISLCAMPPLFISCPERIKNGIASKAKLSRPVPMRCETVVKAGKAGMLTNMVKTEEIEILHATGVPIDSNPTKLITKTKIGI
jgi:hypothetical protein